MRDLTPWTRLSNWGADRHPLLGFALRSLNVAALIAFICGYAWFWQWLLR